MIEQDYSDLSLMFEAEDRALEAAPFVEGVMKRVKRTTRIRRLVLASVGGVGALIAGLQLPGLLAGWAGVDTGVTEAITLARTEVGEVAATNPLWMMVACVVALSVFAVSAMERA